MPRHPVCRHCSTLARMFPCDSITPFGRPDVPDVKQIVASVSSGRSSHDAFVARRRQKRRHRLAGVHRHPGRNTTIGGSGSRIGKHRKVRGDARALDDRAAAPSHAPRTMRRCRRLSSTYSGTTTKPEPERGQVDRDPVDAVAHAQRDALAGANPSRRNAACQRPISPRDLIDGDVLPRLVRVKWRYSTRSGRGPMPRKELRDVARFIRRPILAPRRRHPWPRSRSPASTRSRTRRRRPSREKIAKDLNKRFDLDYEWNGDQHRLRAARRDRTHEWSARTRITLDVSLGWLLTPLKPMFEREITAQLDKLAGPGLRRAALARRPRGRRLREPDVSGSGKRVRRPVDDRLQMLRFALVDRRQERRARRPSRETPRSRARGNPASADRPASRAGCRIIASAVRTSGLLHVAVERRADFAR